MKLRKCSCGNKPKMYFGESGEEHRYVYCENCGLETVNYWDGNEAAANWNWLMRNSGKRNELYERSER